LLVTYAAQALQPAHSQTRHLRSVRMNTDELFEAEVGDWPPRKA
jgi:hypothetical protein